MRSSCLQRLLRAARALLGQLLHLRAARAHEGELGRHEEAVHERPAGRAGRVGRRSRQGAGRARASADATGRASRGRLEAGELFAGTSIRSVVAHPSTRSKLADKARDALASGNSCHRRRRALREIALPSERRRSRRAARAGPGRQGPRSPERCVRARIRTTTSAAPAAVPTATAAAGRTQLRGSRIAAELPVGELLERRRLNLGEPAPRAGRRGVPADRPASSAASSSRTISTPRLPASPCPGRSCAHDPSLSGLRRPRPPARAA